MVHIQGREFESQPDHIIFMLIDHGIFSTAILPRPLLKGQMSVTDEKLCTY